jgi:hypothetical protein
MTYRECAGSFRAQECPRYTIVARVPSGAEAPVLAALAGTADAVPFPFVLDHSSWVIRRRGKPRLYAAFFFGL